VNHVGFITLIYNDAGLTKQELSRFEQLEEDVRMEGERTVIKLLEGKRGGGRKKGRPRLSGWMELNWT
jgi:hypothetical protein